MERRFFLVLLAAGPRLLWAAAAPERTSLRGTLVRGPESKPAIRGGAKVTVVSGDEPTMGVMNDKRLAGREMEVDGHYAQDGFAIDPIHTRSLFAFQDGKKLMVTYWCAVCSIRTYTPGICWCCQQETALDLIPPETLNS